ncbi:class I adenylate-forming enzyme family protein [Oricola indica]|uniref:class I adenylate-forming enzyme family protein n=1 Tax=Oricola indica TaxID=2872591 RepID=UPI001CBF72C1|nr:long-chain-fatty-acid--CoA ligase [Oricola indica]
MIETVGDILRNNAYKFPNELAFSYHGREVTYSAHLDRSNRLASALWKRGLRRQDRVSILSQNTIEFMESYAACELAGYIAATLNWRLAAPELAFIIGDSTPRVLIFEAQYAEILDKIRDQLDYVEIFLCFGGDVPEWAEDYETFLATGDVEGAPSRPLPDEIMHLIYTSGTTGRPKGVMRTHRAEIAVAILMATELGLIVSDRLQLMMPVFHVGARFLQLAMHIRGGTVVLHYGFNPQEIVDTIESERVTMTHMAPTMVQAMLNVPGIEDRDLSSLHTVCYSAAPMPVPLLKRGLKLLGPVFLQLYGMTEGGGTTLHKRQHKPDGTPEEVKLLGSIGQAAPNVDIKIIDEEGNELPVGQPGEILTRTATHMAGYWNNSAATIAALKDGWYYTGDVGYVDEQGFLFLVDRKKDMIVSGGENIYSREVEEAIATHPAIMDVAVIGVKDDYWGETVRAVCVLNAGQSVSEADLIEHTKTQIASYKKPKSIVFIDDLPKLPSGKINKVVLRKEYGAPDAKA